MNRWFTTNDENGLCRQRATPLPSGTAERNRYFRGRAVKSARSEARDRCLILFMFRHGLRVSEAVGLKLSDVDMEGRRVFDGRDGIEMRTGCVRCHGLPLLT